MSFFGKGLEGGFFVSLFYQKEIKEIYEMVESKSDGLTNEEAKQRLQKYGYNELIESKPKPAWKIFIE